MSLINDALKTAQRAKQARESGVRPAPVLVPLKPRPARSSFSLARAAMFGGVVVVVGGVSWLAVGRVRAEKLRPLQPPAPVLLGEAVVVPAHDSTPVRHDSGVVQQQQAVASATQTSTPVPRLAQRRVSSAKPATKAASVVAQPAPSPNGLRISVEQPRSADAAGLFVMAVTAQRSGDLVNARDLYERVLLTSPSDVDAMNNLGVLLMTTREYDRSEQLLRRAVAIAPRNANVWSNLGNVLRDRGQTSDAIAAFQHALTIDPRHAGARISLAQEYMAISSYPEARVILEAIVAETPDAVEAQYTLGQVLEAQGDRAGAVRAYAAFVRAAPARFADVAERVKRRIDALSR